MRAPDVAIIRAGRLPPGRAPKGWSDVVPDLFVEVVSPWNTAGEVLGKAREWLEAGARLVWVVYPDSRTINVLRSLQDRETLTIGDTLEGGDVLQGFSCSVEEIFS